MDFVIPVAVVVTDKVGIATVPVNVGSASGAFRPNAVVTVEANEASSLIAAANSFNVFNVVGAESNIAETAVEAALSAYVLVANAEVSAIPCTLVVASVCEDNSESLVIVDGISESGISPSASNEAIPSGFPISDAKAYVLPDWLFTPVIAWST